VNYSSQLIRTTFLIMLIPTSLIPRIPSEIGLIHIKACLPIASPRLRSAR
jgi:hypothetical protein